MYLSDVGRNLRIYIRIKFYVQNKTVRVMRIKLIVKQKDLLSADCNKHMYVEIGGSKTDSSNVHEIKRQTQLQPLNLPASQSNLAMSDFEHRRSDWKHHSSEKRHRTTGWQHQWHR